MQPTVATVILFLATQFMRAQPSVAGSITETQHALEAGVPVSSRLQLTLHSRARTEPGGLGPYQLRMGPIVKFTLRPNFSILAGYYFTVQQRAERDVRGAHRYFGGLELLAVDKRAMSVELRFLTERFVVTGDDFTRIRNRVRLSANSPVAPYTSGEWFLDRKGWRSVRYSGGVRWRYSWLIDLDAGYFYEPRRDDLGPNRRMFLTGIHFRLKSTKPPDPEVQHCPYNRRICGITDATSIGCDAQCWSKGPNE